MVRSPQNSSATPGKAAPKSGARWDPQDIIRVKEAVRSGKGLSEIHAMFPERSKDGIQHKISEAQRKLKEEEHATRRAQTLANKTGKNLKFVPWNVDEDEKLNKAILDGLSFPEVCNLFPYRSKAALRHRMRRNRALLGENADESDYDSSDSSSSSDSPPAAPTRNPVLTPSTSAQMAKTARSESPGIQGLSPASSIIGSLWSELDNQKLESAIDQDLSYEDMWAMFPERTMDGIRNKVRRIRWKREAAEKRGDKARSSSTMERTPVAQSAPKLSPQSHIIESRPTHNRSSPANLAAEVHLGQSALKPSPERHADESQPMHARPSPANLAAEVRVVQPVPKPSPQDQTNESQLTHAHPGLSNLAVVKPRDHFPHGQQLLVDPKVLNHGVTGLPHKQVSDRDVLMEDVFDLNAATRGIQIAQLQPITPVAALSPAFQDPDEVNEEYNYSKAMRITPCSQKDDPMISGADSDFPTANAYSELRDGLSFDSTPHWDYVSSEYMLGDPFSDISYGTGPVPTPNGYTTPPDTADTMEI